MNTFHNGELFLERYRIDHVLGEGGFGTVYAATDTVATRAVALKILRPDDGARYAHDTRARFTRELQIVANLRSPHTVTLFDGGEAPTGLLYMVFELLPGDDLSTFLQRGVQLEPVTVLHIVWQLLDSLDEAHRLGLLHRDMKPANIRVFEHRGDPYYVKLLDFGLARDVRREHGGVTSTGQLVGTPRYMAPEQLTEKPLSPATDIYSLGLVAYEMLAGSDALGGNHWGAQLERLQSGHVFSIPEIERVGAGLLTVIQRMTARRPEDRYQSIAAVREALQRLQTLDPTSPPKRRPVAHKPPRPAARNTSLLTLVVAAAVVLVVTALGLNHWRDDGASSPPAIPPGPDGTALTKGHAERTRIEDGRDAATRDAGSILDASMASDAPTIGRHRRSRGCDRTLKAGIPSTGEPGPLALSSGEHVYGLLPSGYESNRAHRLVIALHQAASNPEQMLRYSEFATLAKRDGAIVIAPEGHPVATWKRGEHDVTQIRDTFEAVTDDLCIDLAHVYVAGHGRGGHLARRLMCEPWIAAVATSSFRSGRGEPFCDPPNGMRYLMISPLKSDREPRAGGAPCGTAVPLLGMLGAVAGRQVYETDLRSLDEAEEEGRAINRCSGGQQTTFAKGQMRCYIWDCAPEFQSCHLDAGHGWPGAPPRGAMLQNEVECDGPPPEFPLGPHIWDFLLASPPHPSFVAQE